jgi:soluble lytic murein transglycosylase
LIGTALVVVVGLSQLPKLEGTYRTLTLPLNHSSIIREQAAAKGLDPALIAAVIYAETRFQPRESSAGAQGLMQLLPSTALFIARKSGGTAFAPKDLANADVNIRYGSWYLRWLLNHYDGNTVLAVAAYNAGLGNVDQWVLDAHLSGREFKVSEIPFPETRAYVKRVLEARSQYRSKYRRELGLR